MTHEIQLEHLAWPDVESRLRDGYTRVVVACGAVEQHGPHLPLFVDAEHGTNLALAVAREMGRTLVAPTIRIGVSEHHMAFPGTISVSVSTFRAVCGDYVTSLARHGFTRICLLPTHGGNFRPLAEAVGELDELAGPDTQVVAYTDLVGMVERWKGIVEEVSGLGNRVGGHADIAETSLMMHLHPTLVREERFAEGFHPELQEEVIAKILREGFKSVTPNGILGDARGSTAAIGARCIADLAPEIARVFDVA